MSQVQRQKPLTSSEYARGYHERWEAEWHEAAERWKLEYGESWSHKQAHEWLDGYRARVPYWIRNEAKLCTVCSGEIEDMILKGVDPHTYAHEVKKKLRTLAVTVSTGMGTRRNCPTVG